VWIIIYAGPLWPDGKEEKNIFLYWKQHQTQSKLIASSVYVCNVCSVWWWGYSVKPCSSVNVLCKRQQNSFQCKLDTCAGVGRHTNGRENVSILYCINFIQLLFCDSSAECRDEKFIFHFIIECLIGLCTTRVFVFGNTVKPLVHVYV